MDTGGTGIIIGAPCFHIARLVHEVRRGLGDVVFIVLHIERIRVGTIHRVPRDLRLADPHTLLKLLRRAILAYTLGT